jgi:hypothetical protein
MCTKSEMDKNTPIQYTTKDRSRTASYDMVRNTVTVFEGCALVANVEVPCGFPSWRVWEIIKSA